MHKSISMIGDMDYDIGSGVPRCWRLTASKICAMWKKMSHSV